jgi:hypothetical protein
MVVITERKSIRCCYNCKYITAEVDEGVTEIPVSFICNNKPNDKAIVKPTGICQWFERQL